MATVGGGSRLVFNDRAFPWIRTSPAVVAHLDGIGSRLADQASGEAQTHGGGEYGWLSGGNHDRHVTLVFTDDFESVLDSALHSTLFKVIANAAGS
jgi:hypothetical protein